MGLNGAAPAVQLRWVIDDGPLEHLAQVVAPASAKRWPEGTFVIAEATASAAVAARGKRAELLAEAGARVSIAAIEMGSEAAEVLYRHLRQPSGATKNLAEHEAIAWALTTPGEVVLVCHDKRAAHLALAELGRGAAAHPYELWLHLLDLALISLAEFAALCERTRKSEQGVVPLRCAQRLAAP